MAELNARIIAKASGTASEEPLAADLEVAELAVNTADGKLFTKHTDGSVVTISGGSGGAVDSVNGETGVVSLGVFDLNDVSQNYSGITVYPYTTIGGVPSSTGTARIYSPGFAQFNDEDSDGNTIDVSGVTSSGYIYIRITGTTEWYAVPYVGFTAGSVHQFNLDTNWAGLQEVLDTFTSGQQMQLSLTDPGAAIPDDLLDGDILQWVDADQKFKPAQLPDAAATRTLLGIGEYADDAAAGTGGVTSGAMYYNTTSSDYRLKS